MKKLLTALLVLGTAQAFAQFQYAAPVSYYSRSTEAVVRANRVDVVISESVGYASPEDIRTKEATVPGTKVENGNLVIDLTNPKLDVTSVILTNGQAVDVVRTIGGDMGGGGRIIQQDLSRQIQVIQR